MLNQTQVDRDKPRNLEFGLLLWTQGYQLDHLQSLRLLKHFFDNVLLELLGLPHVFPHAVHLIFCVDQVEGVILCRPYSLSSFLSVVPWLILTSTLEMWLGTVRTSVQGQGICTDTASRVASGEIQLLLRSSLMVSLPFVGLGVVMSVKCSL